MIFVEKAVFQNLSKTEVSFLYETLIKAYAETEVEIWGKNYKRLALNEFICLIKKEEVYIARIANNLVGSIHLFKISDTTYSFGLLNTDFNLKGRGIGKALVSKAEKVAVKNGGKLMEIEVLRPANFDTPFKVLLKNWYLKQGYQFSHFDTFINLKPDKPEKVKELITPAGFDCFSKQL